MARKYLIFVIVLGWCAAGLSDVVVFKSGDQLTGKFVKLEKGKLTFLADEVGSVDLDIAKIQKFSADQPSELHFTDGTVIKSRILTAGPEQFSTEKSQLLPAQTFALADLAAVNPPPTPKPRWTGSAAAGLSSTHGNTFTESGSISFDAKRRSEIDRTTLYGLYLVQRAEEEIAGEKEKVTTEESLFLAGKYDYFFTKKLFAFINSSFKKDHIADLDRRIIVGSGLGYQWLESEKMNFNTDFGLAELCEKYTSHGLVTKTDEVSLQMGYHFDWAINDKFVFMHNLTYYPSLEGFSDYFLTADAEIRASINKSMFTNFRVILDYDASPADNIGTTDTKYILGIGWNF